MPENTPTVAFLTSLYARASDWYIRGEVERLRALGFSVHTFSIRRPETRELVSDEIRREYEATEYLLEVGVVRLAMAWLRVAMRSPRRMLEAMQVAIRLGTPGLKGRLWPVAYLIEAAFLSERLLAKGVEHVHNHIGENSASVAMLGSILSSIPFSMTIHGPSEFDRPTQLALGDKIHRAAFTVAISDYCRSQLYRWSDATDWPKIHVIHCGMHDAFLEVGPTPINEDRRLLCVGRLTEQKGPLLLVEAAKRLANEGLKFELVLVGDGPLRRPIEELIERLELQDHVRLAGWLGTEAVRTEILRSRVQVLPSFAEGLPMVLIESMALGRPVISTYVAGIPELVIPDICGWLVPAGSVEALVASMRDALTAPTHRLEQMGRAGAARAFERHKGATEVAKLATLIRASRHTSSGTRLDPEAGNREQFSAWGRATAPEKAEQAV